MLRGSGLVGRDSGAWYRAVCLACGPMSGIGSPVSLWPFGPRGFKSHSRRQFDRLEGKCEGFLES